MNEPKRRKPDLYDHVILIFSIVILLLALFTFAMKWWLGT